MKAEMALARSVISTTQKALSISKEQYHIALSKSCSNSLISGMGYIIDLVKKIYLPVIIIVCLPHSS